MGDSVSEGEIIADKSSLLSSHKVISQFSGIIVNINQEKGEIHVRTSGSQKARTIKAPVDAVIDSLDKEKIVLKTEKDVVAATDGAGGEAEGLVHSLNNSDERNLDHQLAGKVLLAKSFDKIALFKAIGLEAAGIITENLEDVDFIDLQEKNVHNAGG